MTYNSLAFLFFFAIFISVYLLMPSVRMIQAVILLGSLTFYCLAGSPLLLPVFSIHVDQNFTSKR